MFCWGRCCHSQDIRKSPNPVWNLKMSYAVLFIVLFPLSCLCRTSTLQNGNLQRKKKKYCRQLLVSVVQEGKLHTSKMSVILNVFPWMKNLHKIYGTLKVKHSPMCSSTEQTQEMPESKGLVSRTSPRLGFLPLRSYRR